ncbi:uncharacterized protein NP_2682A [Natronomonas pharaonis DSM 2160]|uniref:Uncharacterized protein n=1 Tax=Natronomonas pharaonis (strain ATCC 35678 / DSM 2160 / CIP 103997 / JCM 8858 / NBRC 14720 / NCIMB 2260 / Gabara) TaxID=348780 RepID=A0A1U7EWH1_NATPD|nr:hypothetical protein [Natronomonas pharaonis]CAI49432.1 uncharacterized protein NP_2682A [Natronomonas pharaonis DSM 2160]
MVPGVPDPGVVDRLDIQRDEPDPADRLHADETLLTTVRLSPGWVAVTERALLTFHPDRDPKVVRTPRANVTGITVRRTGGRGFLRYVPGALLYALGAGLVGVVLLTVSPGQFLTVPDAPGAGQLDAIIQTLGWAVRLLGSVLVFTAILAVLTAAVVVLYWLFSRDVAFIIERGDAEPVECPTNRQVGQRALRELRETLN